MFKLQINLSVQTQFTFILTHVDVQESLSSYGYLKQVNKLQGENLHAILQYMCVENLWDNLL